MTSSHTRHVAMDGVFFNKDLPKAIEDLMEISSERSLQIRTKKFNLTTLRKLSPIKFIVESWNRIPIEVKIAGKLTQFKTQPPSPYHKLILNPTGKSMESNQHQGLNPESRFL